MTQGHWEHFPHSADICVREIDATREKAFERVALALTAVITNPESIDCKIKIEIIRDLRELNDTLLVFDWQNAIILNMATTGLIFGRYLLQLRDSGLWGWGWGEAVDQTRHDPATEIKGETMTCLAAHALEDGSYLAQCVVDV